MTFSEAIQIGSGNIIITNLDNATDTRAISISDGSQISIVGTTLTINPTSNLLPGAHYAINIAPGVILDNANNPFAGIVDNTSLDFTAVSTANFSGNIYSWKSHVLIDDVLITPSSGSATSSTDGYFDLSLIVGDYDLTASRSATDDSSGSAITSADALAALKIAVGINPNSDPDGAGPRVASSLSPYQLMAADINGDGQVTSADALAILKMAVGQPGAVPPSWIFLDESQTFDISASSVNYSSAISETLNADQTINMVAVLKGDVNGSWGSAEASVNHVDYGNPTYFADLATRLQVPMDVWGLS